MSNAKQAKFNRHKAIRIMEKLMKNMYRMFRDEDCTLESISKRFYQLESQLSQLGDVHLDTTYYRAIRKYMQKLSSTLQSKPDINAIRASNMTQLNRIQKIKNQASYKRKRE